MWYISHRNCYLFGFADCGRGTEQISNQWTPCTTQQDSEPVPFSTAECEQSALSHHARPHYQSAEHEANGDSIDAGRGSRNQDV